MAKQEALHIGDKQSSIRAGEETVLQLYKLGLHFKNLNKSAVLRRAVEELYNRHLSRMSLDIRSMTYEEMKSITTKNK